MLNWKEIFKWIYNNLKCHDNAPVLVLIDNNTKVTITCECGVEETMSLSDYLSQYNQNYICKIKNICDEHKYTVDIILL